MENHEQNLSRYIFGAQHEDKPCEPVPHPVPSLDDVSAFVSDWKLLFWVHDLKSEKCAMTQYAARLFSQAATCEHFPTCMFGKGVLTQQSETAFRQAFYRLLAGEEHIVFRAVVNAPVDMPKWIEVEYCLEKDADGNPALAIGTAHDISAQKLLEQKYQDQIAYRNGLCANSLNCMRMDLTEDRITESNTPLGVIADMCADFPSADACLRKVTENMVRREDIEAYKDVLTTKGLLKAYEAGSNNVIVEYYDTLFNRWLQISFVILKNPNNLHIECFGICADVSEKKMNEIALNGIAIKNFGFVGLIDKRSSTFLYIPKDMKTETKILSYEDVDEALNYIVGDSSQYFVDDKELEHFRCCIASKTVESAMQASGYYAFQTQANANDGALHHYTVNFTYLDADRMNVLISCVDVTGVVHSEEKHRKELAHALNAAEQANLAKSEFLSRVSHEIRTPINAVTGLAELTRQAIANDTLPEQEKIASILTYANEVTASTQYLLGLVNDILDTAKIESGKMELHIEPFDLNACLNNVRTIIVPLAEQKGLSFVCDATALTHPCYLGDRVRVQQIITNLVNNAIKFTQSGGHVSLRVKDAVMQEHVCGLCILVEDNGCGMTEAFQKTMFEPFTQEYDSRMNTEAGTGLGLAISYRLAHMMDGDITCHSVKGEGTTFTVTLALQPSDGAAATLDSKTAKRNWDFSGKRILVVEDHPLNQKIIRRLLENKGCTVTLADNGKAAVDLLANCPSHDFDLVFMDIRMPVMDGLSAARAIRALPREDIAALPIVAMSANAYPEDIAASLDAGMNDHLTKPVEADLLYDTVERCVSAKPAVHFYKHRITPQ